MVGMKFYRDGCAGCHGDADNPSVSVTRSFYPRVSQFGVDPPQVGSECQAFWILKNGVRYTGMGDWSGLASDDELWKVSLFLSRIESLPLTVATEWEDLHGR
jgi:hypothetical protein